MRKYPKRLIEVDLPIKRISAHARREKSIRHGHISTLHIWWARRPLAACRAVLCASLWPDPVNDLCPDSFREKARELMQQWANKHLKLLSADSMPRFVTYQKNPDRLKNNDELRKALLDFIADFANWDNSTIKEYLETSRDLTQAAHEALGGQPGTKPLVFDPFAGGGSIPLEALRVGADAFASDLNPVAVLLNKVVLEYIPKYGQLLVDEVRRWGNWINKEAEKELAEFYPKDPDGSIPIAYLWARTITCEGPNCGAEVPLMRSLWLAKRGENSMALQLVPNLEGKRISFEIVQNAKADKVGEGTIKRGSAICPVCGYTTPIRSVRRQLKERHGGTLDARLFGIVITKSSERGRFYRLPTQHDVATVRKAALELERRRHDYTGALSLVPDESTENYHTFVNRGPIYGMISWEDYFTSRQLLTLTTLVKLVCDVGTKLTTEHETGLATAVQTCLALVVDRMADGNSSLSRWQSTGQKISNTFGRQALPMVWDFCEANPFCTATRSLNSMFEWVAKVCEHEKVNKLSAQAQSASATVHPLPDDAVQVFFTDPPYYYSVQYADLSDFFYVWLRRTLGDRHANLLELPVTPKQEEIIVQSPGHEFATEGKNRNFYESRMKRAMEEGRRILTPVGIGIVVFAHTSTAGWEAMLEAMVYAGWTVTGSWPIDTEMATRVIAQGRSVLASSVHIICRPRENPDGSVITDYVGDWRDVLQKLPKRIHEWMPRLAKEGVVGADAIFACLGPALEIFSRYSKVEKASGEEVILREYLEHVWAAVAKEALNTIFEGADAAGFEEDSRLTTMWLWTLSTGTNGNGEKKSTDEKTTKLGGYTLEFDAARRIAQGLGAHLENLGRVVEIKGGKARLLSVAERTKYLFGKDDSQAPVGRRKKKDSQMQLDFMAEVQKAEREEGGWGEKNAPRAGETVLDQLHQAMILFAAGRGEAMKRFLVEEGIGRDGRFWRLAQALSALYPANTDEKRWVDGVLARKKSLGF